MDIRRAVDDVGTGDDGQLRRRSSGEGKPDRALLGEDLGVTGADRALRPDLGRHGRPEHGHQARQTTFDLLDVDDVSRAELDSRISPGSPEQAASAVTAVRIRAGRTRPRRWSTGAPYGRQIAAAQLTGGVSATFHGRSSMSKWAGSGRRVAKRKSLARPCPRNCLLSRTASL